MRMAEVRACAGGAEYAEAWQLADGRFRAKFSGFSGSMSRLTTVRPKISRHAAIRSRCGKASVENRKIGTASDGGGFEGIGHCTGNGSSALQRSNT